MVRCPTLRWEGLGYRFEWLTYLIQNTKYLFRVFSKSKFLESEYRTRLAFANFLVSKMQKNSIEICRTNSKHIK